jgi:hypothetical protein
VIFEVGRGEPIFDIRLKIVRPPVATRISIGVRIPSSATSSETDIIVSPGRPCHQRQILSYPQLGHIIRDRYYRIPSSAISSETDIIVSPARPYHQIQIPSYPQVGHFIRDRYTMGNASQFNHT